METIFLEPVAGKPSVFLANADGLAAVWAYRKEEFEAKDKLKTVRFGNEHVAAAKAVAANLKLPAYLAVEVEMGGQPWASYAVPVAICSRFFPRWAFPLRPAARRVFDTEPEIVKRFRASVVESVAAA